MHGGWGCSFREVGFEEEKVVGAGVGDCDDEADGAVDGWIVRRWGFLSSAGLLVRPRQDSPDIATRYVGRPVNTHLQKSADGHFRK